MKYILTPPDEAIKHPDIQDLLGRHRDLYEKYWFSEFKFKSPELHDDELSLFPRFTGVTAYDFDAEYVIDDCIAVMRKVNFHIMDWRTFEDGDDFENESELPYIDFSAFMILPSYAGDSDMIEKIYKRRMEFPHDGLEEWHKQARLHDATEGLEIYKCQLAEDIDEQLLEDEIKFMFEFTDRRMKKIGFLRTS